MGGTGVTEKDPSCEEAAPAKEAGGEIATMMAKMVGRGKDEEKETPSETVDMTVEMKTGLEEGGEGEPGGAGEEGQGREEVMSAGQTPLIASMPETAVSSGSSAAVAAALLASAPTPTPAPVPASPANMSVLEHERWPLPGLLAEEGVTKAKHLNVVAVPHAAAVGKWLLSDCLALRSLLLLLLRSVRFERERLASGTLGMCGTVDRVSTLLGGHATMVLSCAWYSQIVVVVKFTSWQCVASSFQSYQPTTHIQKRGIISGAASGIPGINRRYYYIIQA